jgi:hypothetical protein
LILFVSRQFVARRALIDLLAARAMQGTADLWLASALLHPEAERPLLMKAEACAGVAGELRDHARLHLHIALHGIAPELVPSLPPTFGAELESP